MEELLEIVSGSKSPNIEYTFEGDALFAIENGQKKGRLNFSLGMAHDGDIQGKIDLLVTNNYRFSVFENSDEVVRYYREHVRSLILDDIYRRDLGYQLILEFIRYAKSKGAKRIYLEPDTTGKRMYWKEKVGKKLLESGVIKKYFGREEICFLL